MSNMTKSAGLEECRIAGLQDFRIAGFFMHSCTLEILKS
jgi:hypothetical protein